MITKTDALTRQQFFHVTARNSDGTAVRCRANGACKTWKTRPDDFRLPVKYGLRDCFYLTPSNADEWLAFDPTERADPLLDQLLSDRSTAGRAALADYLMEREVNP